ncbi:MAG: hypothetical protein JNL11_06690 [Bdellovibrionaceae bacterium]|nr:hypothetical protein [Pseudobdellovibrionaceae bacterium]
MKKCFLFLMCVWQISFAARIVEARWDGQTQSVVVDMAYRGGCLDHEFRVQWIGCVVDAEGTGVVSRLGNILDTGWQDACEDDLAQTITFVEPHDSCRADVIVLKSTSSKVPHVIVK